MGLPRRGQPVKFITWSAQVICGVARLFSASSPEQTRDVRLGFSRIYRSSRASSSSAGTVWSDVVTNLRLPSYFLPV